MLVDSAEEHQTEAEELGIEVQDFVDAANTLAVFVWLPERVKLEYVEHKPTFSLAIALDDRRRGHGRPGRGRAGARARRAPVVYEKGTRPAARCCSRAA